MIALLDNTVLSNFAIVARPELIRDALGDAAATVEEAFAEFQTGVQLGRLPASDWSWLRVLRLDEPERATYEQLRVRFGWVGDSVVPRLHERVEYREHLLRIGGGHRRAS